MEDERELAIGAETNAENTKFIVDPADNYRFNKRKNSEGEYEYRPSHIRQHRNKDAATANFKPGSNWFIAQMNRCQFIERMYYYRQRHPEKKIANAINLQTEIQESWNVLSKAQDFAGAKITMTRILNQFTNRLDEPTDDEERPGLRERIASLIGRGKQDDR